MGAIEKLAVRSRRQHERARLAEERRALLLEEGKRRAWAYDQERRERKQTELEASGCVLRPISRAALREMMSGYVYAMRCESGPVKIGYTEIVRTRFLAVGRQRSGSLRIEDCLCVRHADMRKVELFAHNHLWAYRLTPQGEWFAASPESVQEAFDSAIAHFDRARRTDDYRDF